MKLSAIFARSSFASPAMVLEKARVFDPLGHAGFDPSGKIRLPP